MNKAQRLLEFLDIPRDVLKSRAIPAINLNGTLLRGRRGETHDEIASRRGLEPVAQKNRGFIDPATNKYYTKLESNLDSADLMNRQQLHQHFPWAYESRSRASAILAKLNEYAATTQINPFGERVTIYHDPNAAQIAKVASSLKQELGIDKRLRILHDPKDNTLHIWDGYGANHWDAEDALGIEHGQKGGDIGKTTGEYSVFLRPHGVRDIPRQVKEKHPELYKNIVAAIGKDYPQEMLHGNVSKAWDGG